MINFWLPEKLQLMELCNNYFQIAECAIDEVFAWLMSLLFQMKLK